MAVARKQSDLHNDIDKLNIQCNERRGWELPNEKRLPDRIGERFLPPVFLRIYSQGLDTCCRVNFGLWNAAQYTIIQI